MGKRGIHRRRRPPPTASSGVSEAYFNGRIFLSPDPTSNQVFISIGLSSKRHMQFPEYQPVILGGAISEEDYNALAEDLVTFIDENGIDLRNLPYLLCCTCCIGALYLRKKSTELEEEINTKILTANWRIAASPTLIMTANKSLIPAYDSMGMMCRNGNMPIWPPMGYNIILDFPPEYQIRRKWPQSQSMFTTLHALSSLPQTLNSQSLREYHRMQMEMIHGQNPELSEILQQQQVLPISVDIPIVEAQPVSGSSRSNGRDHNHNRVMAVHEAVEDIPPSISDQIHCLTDLKTQGIITEAQFEAGKEYILANHREA